MELLSGVYKFQPQSRPQINSAGIGRGMIACASFGLGMNIDLVNPNRTYSIPGGTVPTPLGTGATVIVSSHAITPSSNISVAANSDYTAVYAINNLVPAGVNSGFWRDGSPDSFNVIRAATGRPWIRHNTADILPGTSGFAETTGRPIVCAFRVRSAKDAAYASDGIIRVTATHTTATGAFDIAVLGYQNTAAESITGNWTFFGFWNRALDDVELIEVTKNPWCVFRAPKRQWFIAQPGAAPTFNTAWNAAANTAIIGGQHAA